MTDDARPGIDLDAALEAGGAMSDEEAAQMGRAGPLLAMLVGQSHRDLAYTTNALLEGYKHDATRARAELMAIRAKMAQVLASPYAPSAWVIQEAIWPDDELIDSFAADIERERL